MAFPLTATGRPSEALAACIIDFYFPVRMVKVKEHKHLFFFKSLEVTGQPPHFTHERNINDLQEGKGLGFGPGNPESLF